MKCYACVAGLLFVYYGCISAKRDGAPEGACNEQFPGHSFPEQTSAAPYEIVVSDTEYSVGQTLTVTLRGLSGTQFKGFLVQARTLVGNERAGTFSATNANQQLRCDEEGVTHTDNDDKDSVQLTWTAPADPVGHIRFRATVVQSFTTFWIRVRSEQINDLTVDPDITLPPSTTVTDPPTSDITIDLEPCGDAKGCYRSPPDCDIDDCDAVVTWIPQENDEPYIEFEMQGQTDGWIGIGFSEDESMGSDYVIMCYKDGDSSRIRSSYNDGRSNGALNDIHLGLTDMRVAAFEDGYVKCAFRRYIDYDSISSAKRRKRASDEEAFVPLDRAYTLLLGRGPISGGRPSKHDSLPSISDKKVDVTTDAVDVGAAPFDFLLYKLHGIFMITAWMFLVSLSLLLARFYKPAFPGKKLCGEKVWFAIHRFLNTAAVAFTIAAFVIIFVQVEGFTEISDDDSEYLKAHPILGIVVTSLAIINPIMALFRPHPDEPRRPIFNWFHWGVGTLAHVASIVTIFFGFDMPKSRPFIEEADRDWVRYVLIGFCVMHLLVYVILDIDKCRSDRNKKEGDIQKELELTSQGYQATNTGISTDQHSFSLGYALLGIYVTGSVGAYAAIVYGIASADTD